MKNVLEYYDNVESACSFWRGRGPLTELERSGYVSLTLADWANTWGEIRRHDIAFFQRPMAKMCLNKVAMCKDMGIKVWVDLDDWFEIPIQHPRYVEYKEIYDFKCFRKVLLLADVITVTNNKMKEYCIDLEDRVSEKIRVIPNAINDYVYKLKPYSNKKIILWRGGDHHDYDMKPYAGIIKEVMSMNKGWTFLSTGSKVEELESLSNYEHIGSFNIHNYMGLISNLRPGIVVVPLVKNKLNECKSHIAWLEATMGGGIAMMPEWSTADHAWGYKDEKDFGGLLHKLMHVNDRDAIHKNSVSKVKEKYLLSVTNEERLKVMNEICEMF